MPGKRKPIPRPGAEPKTGWQKARPYVFGVGVPAIAAVVVIVISLIIFRPSPSLVEDVYIKKTEIETVPVEPVKGKKSSVETVQPISSSPAVYSDAGDTSSRLALAGTVNTMAGTSNTATIQTIETQDTSVLSVIDTAGTRRMVEEQLQKEIETMRNTYHSKRQGLLNDAVSFLRGRHSERGVRAKAANFRKLAESLQKSLSDFPQPSSDAERKLWDAQKEEMQTSIDFCRMLADRISATQGVERKMRIAANQLEAQGAP